MAKFEKKQAKAIFKLPEGRLINHALFERDVFKPERGAEGEPQYKVELVFDPKDVQGEGTIEDELLNACLAEWGDTKATEDDFFNGKIGVPFIDGTEYAAKRAEKGKPGDAYKGKIIIRASTKYNKDGNEGPGGIQVWNENVEPIGLELGNANEVYQGCYGVAAVTITCGISPGRNEKYVKFYLSAFQKTRDGEKLVTGRDTSSLFKPVGRAEGSAEGGRRTRRG